ncbi:MAG TPA: hypothetical protein VJR89_27195 [Polyangiales bacterium]|nr:hypothetical protein [Polyangiales bacterium]
MAIVWGVTLALQALVLGTTNLFSWIADAGWVSAELALPSVHTDCSTATSPASSHALTPADARRAAYKLGFGLGFAAGLRGLGTDPTTFVTQSRADNDQIAAALGVPRPELPQVIHQANTLHEFAVHIESDPQCIASLLAKGYSAQHAALYRFAASLAHVLVYRSVAPQLGPLFVVQLRSYGQAAGIPEQLWAPVQDVSPLPVEAARERMAAMAATIERYVAGEP